MKTLEESVVTAMDGSDTKLFPFLPYIMQDLWEIGSEPETMIRLIRKHVDNPAGMKVLDIGCGKGAVSVKVSKALGCQCHGIDAIPEFIAFARQKAEEYQVGHLCTFEVGDIRERVKDLAGFDIIILGSVGPVLGDHLTTLRTLSGCIHKDGMLIVDDGYTEDSSDFTHPLISKRKDLLQQVDAAGMNLVEEEIIPKDDIRASDDHIFKNIKIRCRELMEKHPADKKLFLDYLRQQEIENDVLENKIIASTMVIRFKGV